MLELKQIERLTTQDVTPREMAVLPRPLLRWAGSKRQVVPLLLQHVPTSFERYIEPFVGSGAFFFALQPRRSLISDTNPDLVQFYQEIRRQPLKLYLATRSLPFTKSFYFQLRAVDPSSLSAFDRAVRFYYLNRLCYNGVYRVNKNGQFNVPMGSKIAPLPSPELIQTYARQLRRASIQCADFEDVLDSCGSGDFVYADPPYYATRHRGEYGAHRFGEKELSRLITAARKATRRGAMIALSYSDNLSLHQELRDWRFISVTVKRNVAGRIDARGFGNEGLFISYIAQ